MAELAHRPRFAFSRLWVASGSWWLRTWDNIRPRAEARRGAVWAAVACILWAAIIGALNLKSGFGILADLLFSFAVALIGIPLSALFIALLVLVLRRLPPVFSGFFVSAAVFVGLLWFGLGSTGLLIGSVLVFLECSLGAACATILLGGLHFATLGKRIATVLVLALAIAGNFGIVALLRSDGVNETLLQVQAASPLPAQLSAADPAEPGPYAVATLFYGSGTDLRRPEYRQSVAIHTPAVDASKFFKDFDGWKAYLRRVYWGFGLDKLPLNARVWYPQAAGPFPLVLIVHGNNNMSEFSDPGYGYLGELFASRGFIAASVDENFLNSGLFHDLPKQQAVRAWLLLEHLRLWHAWNASAGNPFYGKVDLNNVALIGHSRGGEAVATAALFNNFAYYPDDATIHFHYGFPIKSIAAIAPPDGQYQPAGHSRILNDVNYLTIQGANDGDVSSFLGSRQWDRVHFSGSANYFKSEIYIYRANHGQFNTAWGRTDVAGPPGWFLNLRPLLTGGEQRRIAKIYLSAFLESTLHNRSEYTPLFQDYRTIRGWLPNTLYVNRFLDSSNKTICNFMEDADVTTTTLPGGRIEARDLTVWREAKIPFRNGDRDYNGVTIGWNRQQLKHPQYAIHLPGEDLRPQSAITLSAAATDDPDSDDKATVPTDFTVAFETTDGVTSKLPLSRFGAILPPIKVRFTKLDRLDKMIYKESSEPIFQSFVLPLADFASSDPRFIPSHVKTIRFDFDRTPSRVIIVSAIGLNP